MIHALNSSIISLTVTLTSFLQLLITNKAFSKASKPWITKTIFISRIKSAKTSKDITMNAKATDPHFRKPRPNKTVKDIADDLNTFSLSSSSLM